MRAFLVSAVAGLALVSGCSGSVSVGDDSLDRADVEKEVSSQLEAQVGQAPDDVTCPGDLAAEVGTKMTCTLTAGEDQLDVYLVVTSIDDGHVKFEGLESEGQHTIRRVEGVRAAYGARLAAQKEGLQRLTRSTDWTVHLHRTDRSPQTVLLSLYLAMADLRRLTAA